MIYVLGACQGSTTTSNHEETSGGSESESTAASEGDDWGDDDWENADGPSVESHHGAIEQIGITGPDSPWSEMNAEEREWYMIGKVLPVMKELFVQHDAQRWNAADYGCETCHGSNMRDVNYAMPSASQYRVPQPGTPAWSNMERIFPDMVRFMSETVTPSMGTLLGIENYTCHHCHPSAS